ncbi:21817_t:CDS:2, partial [Entrophospora sp. SA101]
QRNHKLEKQESRKRVKGDKRTYAGGLKIGGMKIEKIIQFIHNINLISD